MCAPFRSTGTEFGVKDNEMQTHWRELEAAQGSGKKKKYLEEQLKSRRPEEPKITGQSRSE